MGRAWKIPTKKTYDVIIIGAGGHGLASAFYLAKNHGIKNIAIEKGYLEAKYGVNTTIVNQTTCWMKMHTFMKVTQTLGATKFRLNFNVMFRRCLNLAHTDSQMIQNIMPSNTMRLNGLMQNSRRSKLEK